MNDDDSLSRRSLVVGTALLPAAVSGLESSSKDEQFESPIAALATTVRALVDTLLPKEGLSPAASELGVDQAVLQAAHEQAQFGTTLRRGCHWLNEASTGLGASSFAALNEPQRVALVERAQSSRTGSDRYLSRFVTMILRYSTYVYYSDPRSWTDLGLHGPPQPQGYPDFDRPFKRA